MLKQRQLIEVHLLSGWCTGKKRLLWSQRGFRLSTPRKHKMPLKAQTRAIITSENQSKKDLDIQ